MTGAGRLWAGIAVGLGCAGLLLAFAPPPVRDGWSAAIALPAGLSAGAGLFLVAERRLPVLPRPSPGGAEVWLAKHALLALWAGVEEVVWRRALLGQLVRVMPIAAALAVGAAAFALWHRPVAPEHVLAGLLFGGLYLGTGSLVAAWAAHVAYNGSIAAADEAARARPGGVPP